MSTKSTKQLWDDLGVTAQLDRDASIQATKLAHEKPTPRDVQLINCVSCGDVMDVKDDPENWQLQCGRCKATGEPLPAGYEHLIGGKHDES